MSKILYGKEVAALIEKELKDEIDELQNMGICPTLAILRVGGTPGDIAYEKAAIKKADLLSVAVKKFTLPEDATEEDVISAVDNINRDCTIHGALILRPFPEFMNDERIRNRLVREKDVDAITDEALARVFSGKGRNYPCTARACMEILKYNHIPIAGKVVLVIGRSLVIGKPMSMLLQKENATVIMAHSRTSMEQMINLSALADIVVVATGKQDTFTSELAHEGQTVLDVGMNRGSDGKLVGDVDFDGVSELVEAITPVPGGVGSVTTAVLFKQLIESVRRIAGLDED